MPPKITEKPEKATETPAREKPVDKTPDKASEAKAAEAARLAATRQRDLDAAISSITKAYGEGSIMRLGDAHALKQIEVIPTGALAVDLALGVGGVPRGRVIEIFGPESSGKTTLMRSIMGLLPASSGLVEFWRANSNIEETSGVPLALRSTCGRRRSSAARRRGRPTRQRHRSRPQPAAAGRARGRLRGCWHRP